MGQRANAPLKSEPFIPFPVVPDVICPLWQKYQPASITNQDTVLSWIKRVWGSFRSGATKSLPQSCSQGCGKVNSALRENTCLPFSADWLDLRPQDRMRTIWTDSVEAGDYFASSFTPTVCYNWAPAPTAIGSRTKHQQMALCLHFTVDCLLPKSKSTPCRPLSLCLLLDCLRNRS